MQKDWCSRKWFRNSCSFLALQLSSFAADNNIRAQILTRASWCQWEPRIMNILLYYNTFTYNTYSLTWKFNIIHGLQHSVTRWPTRSKCNLRYGEIHCQSLLEESQAIVIMWISQHRVKDCRALSTRLHISQFDSIPRLDLKVWTEE